MSGITWRSPAITSSDRRRTADQAAPAGGCGESRDARRSLQIASGQRVIERHRRVWAEQVLGEQLGQELAGISLVVGALTRSRPMLEADRDVLVQRIAKLLSVAIERCQRMPSAS